MDRFPRLSQEIIGNSDEQQAFSRHARDLRDMEAHLGEGTRGSIDGKTHLGTASKLKVLIDASLLVEIGFVEDQMLTHMQANREYWHYASAETWPWAPD